MATDTTPQIPDAVPDASGAVTSSSAPPPAMVCETTANAIDVGDDAGTWHWHLDKIIALFMAFDVNSRQKQTIARVYRAKFAAGCYMKFAKKMKAEGK